MYCGIQLTHPPAVSKPVNTISKRAILKRDFITVSPVRGKVVAFYRFPPR